jgi:8-oxo-dGTP pyrophosphatase MutT (NUDIX family)
VTVPFGVPAQAPLRDQVDNGPRLGARVLLLDADDRLLLLRAHDPAEPDRRWWELPGGGLHAGETTARACQRELAEETGIHLDLDAIGPCVWVRETRFRFRRQHYHRREWVHLARLPHAGPPAPVQTRHTANERLTLLGERWWSVAELAAATGEWFLPPNLPALLTDILAGRYSANPVELLFWPG